MQPNKTTVPSLWKCRGVTLQPFRNTVNRQNMTTKKIESLKEEVPYKLFNRSGVKFNEKLLDEVVLEDGHKTIINGIEFIAHKYNAEGNKFCFGVKMQNVSNYRSNTSQIRVK